MPEFNNAAYWDRRYRDGRTSGAGSEGTEGTYKAKYVSDFIREQRVTSVIDWGCGDGQVLKKLELPEHVTYAGVDVSTTIVAEMKKQFPQHQFYNAASAAPGLISAEMGLSMDVLFHFPDESAYDAYLARLFDSAIRYVIIYATDTDEGRTARHVHRRSFTKDVKARFPQWKLITREKPLRMGLASFFVYEKQVN